MKKKLRYYQQEAVTALLNKLREDKSSIPYVEMCTGSGKSLVAAHLSHIALKNNKRVLQLVPSKELVEQNFKELIEYSENNDKCGIVSASLNKFQLARDAIIATPGSLKKRVMMVGKIDLIIIDEAHLLSPKLDSYYWRIINYLVSVNPSMRIIGMTATPYRMDMGLIHEVIPEHKGKTLFTECAYKTDIFRMIQEGYLSNIINISGELHANIDGVPVSGRDYDNNIMGARFDEIVSHAVKDMKEKYKAKGVKTSIIFASNLDNAKHIMHEWGDNSIRLIHGGSGKEERKKCLDWLKNGQGSRHIVNVEVLTTGFDYPALNCVTLMRSTKSSALYVQIVGRVIRAHDDKDVGYVLDYGTNIERLGGIASVIVPKAVSGKIVDNDEEKKELSEYVKCQSCGAMTPRKFIFCQLCGEKFHKGNNDYSMRSDANVLFNDATTWNISAIDAQMAWSVKKKKPMIKLFFFGENGGVIHEHYLCLEHGGIAAQMAQQFLLKIMKNPDYWFITLPTYGGATVENVMEMFDEYNYHFNDIKTITLVKQDNRFNIIGLTLKKQD